MQWWNNRRGQSDDSPLAAGVSSREERLSLYLDNELTPEELADIEAELERDSDLRSSLEGMALVRDALGEFGKERAPRSFTLVAAQAPRTRGYRGGIPRFEIVTRFATAVAALGLTLAVGAPLLMTSTGGDDESTAGGAASEVAMSAATAETPGAELMQSMAAPEETPAAEGQPPVADDAAGNGQGGDSDGAGGASPESGTAEERQFDPNGTPAETSLKTLEDGALADGAASANEGVDTLQIAQFGLAGLTVALLLTTGGLYLMRKRGIGFYR